MPPPQRRAEPGVPQSRLAQAAGRRAHARRPRAGTFRIAALSAAVALSVLLPLTAANAGADEAPGAAPGPGPLVESLDGRPGTALVGPKTPTGGTLTGGQGLLGDLPETGDVRPDPAADAAAHPAAGPADAAADPGSGQLGGLWPELWPEGAAGAPADGRPRSAGQDGSRAATGTDHEGDTGADRGGDAAAGPSAVCGPQVGLAGRITAQTCLLAADDQTWARTYYRNSGGGPLKAVLTLMRPDGRTLQVHCEVPASRIPGSCETPRERTLHPLEGEEPYSAVAEIASADGERLLLRTGSNSPERVES